MNEQKEKDIKDWETAAKDMLYLTECSINSCVPDQQRVNEMDLQKVYALSRSQSLESMTYIALERLIKGKDVLLQEDSRKLLLKWEESKNKVIRKTLLMNAEREKLFRYMEEHKIWHLPLKGVILSTLYPEFGMRQMADNDILFDASFRKNVRDWFATHGYTVKSYEEGNHDEYHKDPVYNFEMHISLFHEQAQVHFAEYYASIKSRLHLKSGKAFEYSMTDEDFYLYMLAHIYKHDSNCGTGLRSLVDIYVYNREKVQIDATYLDEELKKIGLYDFEKELKKLAFKVFAHASSDDPLTEKEERMLQNMLFNRTYGTIENYWRKQVKKVQENGQDTLGTAKRKYLLKRLFPGKEHMEKWCELYAPFFTRHPWLMPAAGIWRIIRKENRDKIKSEFDTVKKM